MYGFSVSEQCKWRLHVPRLQDGAEKSFKRQRDDLLHQRDEIRRNEDCRRDREVLLVDQAKCLDLVSVQITKFFDFIEAGRRGFICPMLRRSATAKLAHFPFLRSHSNGSVSAWCVLFTS